MNIQPVKNIFPHLLTWAKTQTPDYDVSWAFNCGEDSWFPFDFRNIVDWEKATSEKYIGILDCDPFYGHYDSDEVHEYKFLFVEGKIVCLYFKVGDRSTPNFYWFENNKTEIMGELLRRFPNIQSEDVELLTEETSEKISSSCYMTFVMIDGELYQYNKMPYWGFLRGNGKKLLFKENGNELEFIGEIEKFQTRFPGIPYFGDGGSFNRADFHMVDGSVIVTKDMISEDVEYHMFQKVVGV